MSPARLIRRFLAWDYERMAANLIREAAGSGMTGVPLLRLAAEFRGKAAALRRSL